nr:hypothetical protein [Streptomyces antimycoticus]
MAFLLEHFLLQEPSWFFRLDAPARQVCLRSLLPPEATVLGSGGYAFSLQTIFTYGRTVQVGADDDARDLLMLRLIFSAYLEGLLPRRSELTPVSWSP